MRARAVLVLVALACAVALAAAQIDTQTAASGGEALRLLRNNKLDLILPGAMRDHKIERTSLESSIAKLYASEIAVRAAEEGVQIHGGYGFVKDYPAEKYFRDVKLVTIGEGTSEIQRLVIARQLL